MAGLASYLVKSKGCAFKGHFEKKYPKSAEMSTEDRLSVFNQAGEPLNVIISNK